MLLKLIRGTLKNLDLDDLSLQMGRKSELYEGVKALAALKSVKAF